MPDFSLARIPRVHFGPGKRTLLPELLERQNLGRLLCVTGKRSFEEAENRYRFFQGLKDRGIETRIVQVCGEPSPETVDALVREAGDFDPQGVLALGGGSVIDTGKAVSAMLPVKDSVAHYLEGVGTKTPPGDKVFFIALPTTSGTGSEATKNAVISRVGAGGFKKSLRHDNYVPDLVVVDPELILSCPKGITAASGLDAITQLLEGYVSTAASPFTDALAASGFGEAGKTFARAVEQGTEDLEARTGMAYAAFLSGIVLANADLGVVHGLAGFFGGRFPVPHGVACGTLVAKATEIIVERLFDEPEKNRTALDKYASAGVLLAGDDLGNREKNCRQLVDQLYRWTKAYDIPPLGEYGITEADCLEASSGTNLRKTPVFLTEDDCRKICLSRL
ncbi:MAG: iron-containing alcohol dehydrogenase [Spirochaetales bacterium]|nr:iron-containing alcohol dehydrogenase [Spirochaetales bacterium]